MPENKKSLGKLLLDGIWGENPVLRLALGICPALAIATTGWNGLAIGVATAAVLVCAELVISILHGLMDGPFRVPVVCVVVAALSVGAQMVLRHFYPEINAALGIYVPLIAANTLLLTRTETFAGQNGPMEALVDGVGMGIGYACALALLGAIREVFAFGTAFGDVIFTSGFEANALALLPAGGFMLLGLVMGVFNAVVSRRKGKEDASA